MTPDRPLAAFLRELTRRHDGFLVWKHLDRALLGRGDIDAAAPAARVATIAGDVAGIAASTLGATHVVRCDHVADKVLHFFVVPPLLPRLVELDLSSQPSRGLAPWAGPEAMLPLAVTGPDGIRRLRAGAEALVALVYHGLSHHGGDRLPADEKEVVERGLTHDLPGLLQACRTLPPRPAREPLLALADGLAAGSWRPRQARRAMRGFVASGPAHPIFTARRVVFRARLASAGGCVMGELALRGRQVPDSGIDQLLHDARVTGHPVTEMAAALR